MLIATWNVNSILVRMPNVMRWLDDVNPDVLCMQETKCTDDKFPILDFQARGYQCQLFGQATYNGVAILNGSLAQTETSPDPIFGVNVPVSCPDVPNEVLQPRNTWADKEAYDRQAEDLSRRFNRNFQKYEQGVSHAVRAVSPKVWD